MKLKLAACGVMLAVPWLIGASMGPVGLMGAWVAAVLVLAALLFSGSSLFWPQSLIFSASASLCLGFMQYVGWAGQLIPWVAEAGLGEMLGNLRQRNQLATLFAMGLLGVLALRDLKQTILPGLALLVALLGFGNALTGSRTGLLQWAAVLCFAWMWLRSWGKTQIWLLCAAVAGFGAGVVLAPWLAQIAGHANAGLLGRAEDANAFSRIALWSNVIELIWREPLLGHGWRSLAYAHYSTEFSGARFMEMLDNAHNLPLHLAVELGLPVALAFCGLVGWLIWRNKPWAETHSDRQLAWGILMVIGIHSMVEYPLWYGPFFMTTVICIGILCGDVWRNWLLAVTDTARRAIDLGVKAFAVLLLAGTVFVAFDYHRVSQIYLQPEERSSWYGDDPLDTAKKSVLFQSHAKFAELQITPLSRETAARVLELSSELIHWSPEPRIIEKLIESATMMGLDDVAAFHLKRYKVAYPAAYALWAQRAS
jgi:O-antigen ligase